MLVDFNADIFRDIFSIVGNNKDNKKKLDLYTQSDVFHSIQSWSKTLKAVEIKEVHVLSCAKFCSETITQWHKWDRSKLGSVCISRPLCKHWRTPLACALKHQHVKSSEVHISRSSTVQSMCLAPFSENAVLFLWLGWYRSLTFITTELPRDRYARSVEAWGVKLTSLRVQGNNETLPCSTLLSHPERENISGH